MQNGIDIPKKISNLVDLSMGMGLGIQFFSQLHLSSEIFVVTQLTGNWRVTDGQLTGNWRVTDGQLTPVTEHKMHRSPQNTDAMDLKMLGKVINNNLNYF